MELTKKQIEKIINWCRKNNTIRFTNSNLRLNILDGGWVNVIELEKFLKEDLE
jgi:hypothetical protein